LATLILVRHGQSAWNLENRFTGWVDVELTPHGEEEARLAGRLLKEFHWDVAFTSALRRAQHTLEIILHETNTENIPVISSAALNERNYGNLQGLNKAETEIKFGAQQVLEWRRSFDVAPPGGESLKDTLNRVVPYYRSEILPELKAGKDVLIVAHGNSLRALVMHLEALTKEEVLKLNLETGVPRVYELDQDLKIAKHWDLTGA
jgi:2,3-bisphosphoglycerate-dependent phosphoglycerate mutase